MSKLKSMDELFSGRQSNREPIIETFHWYMRYKLSLRDLVEMMAERRLTLTETTIRRWQKRYMPVFVKRWDGFCTPAVASWRVDETYVTIRGKWIYLYRAMDRTGQTVDLLLRAKRDVNAVNSFSSKVIKHKRKPPRTITLDGYAASHRAVPEMKADGLLPEDTKIRLSKYPNNLIEQHHRLTRCRTNVMRSFRNAAITLASIELMHCIRKVNSISGSSASTIPAHPSSGVLACLLDKKSFLFEPYLRGRLFAPEPRKKGTLRRLAARTRDSTLNHNGG